MAHGNMLASPDAPNPALRVRCPSDTRTKEDRLAPRHPMTRSLLKAAVAVAALALVPTAPLRAHDVPGDPTSARAVKPVSMELAATEMADAAIALWNSLTPEQQKTASYEF